MTYPAADASMPSKTISDLADNERVMLKFESDESRCVAFHVSIAVLVPDAKKPWWNRDPFRALSAGLEGGLYMVTISRVEPQHSGWGPFLYDVAMEYATLQGAALRPHNREVSDDAKKVWRFYFEHRKDVSRSPLTNTRMPKSRTAELKRSYRKPPVLIDALKAAKKWIGP